MKLIKKDYIEILNFYNINVTNKTPIHILKDKVEKIIATKLCHCIKKVDSRINNENKSIGICNFSVLGRKKIQIYKFTCKKKPQLYVKSNMRKNSDKIYKLSKEKLTLKKRNKKN
tara:strand:- start:266 stop:610 length:345 start_codon:yes stop_codon:yes gene_type:complete